MSKKTKEIERLEAALTTILDTKNLTDLADRRLDVGHTAKKVGRVIRRDNPQMWVESKFAESVARALL